EEEAGTIAPLFGAPWPDVEQFCRFLSVNFGLRGVAVTAGGSGASLLLDDVFAQAPAPSVVVADTIGSGDAFAAALVDGILAGAPTETILRRSISLGALVASYAGAMPAWDAAELAALEGLDADGPDV